MHERAMPTISVFKRLGNVGDGQICTPGRVGGSHKCVGDPRHTAPGTSKATIGRGSRRIRATETEASRDGLTSQNVAGNPGFRDVPVDQWYSKDDGRIETWCGVFDRHAVELDTPRPQHVGNSVRKLLTGPISTDILSLVCEGVQ